MKTLITFAAALLTLTATGCTTYSFGHRDRNCDPDERLAALLDVYDRCQRGVSDKHPLVDCDRARNEIERLASEFPTHVPTLMANAVLAHDEHENAKAERYLDSLFAVQPAHPEAGVLRAQLALDDGNLQGARRMVETQISYTPDHPLLREMHSSVLYLAHDLEGAKAEITAAEKLGAPAWRVAFNRGLIAESAGEKGEAQRLYQAAADANPEFKPARSRLAGMKAGTGYNVGTSPPGKAGGG